MNVWYLHADPYITCWTVGNMDTVYMIPITELAAPPYNLTCTLTKTCTLKDLALITKALAH